MSELKKIDPKKLRRAGTWAVAIAALIGGAAVAEQVVVKTKTVAIQPTPSGMGSPVEMVPEKTALEVIGRQGSWLKVRTPGGKEGFVKEGALASQSFSTGSGVLRGDAASRELNASLAGKGLEPPAKEYARRNNVDPRAIERVLKLRDGITSEQFDKFQREGKLGAYASH